MITKFKKILKEQKIDYFLQPNSDEFFSEYLPESEKYIEFLTNFSGSNATVFFGQKKSYFFTDGRYLLQCKNQLDNKEFEVIDLAQKSILSWVENNISQGQTLALVAKLFSIRLVKNLSEIAAKKNFNLALLTENPIDKIWQNRPPKNSAEIYFLNDKAAGKSSKEKRQEICAKMLGDLMLISKPENLCWLLNMRSKDLEFTPICNAWGILFKNGDLDLFVDEKRILDKENPNLANVNTLHPDFFDLRISVLAKKFALFQIDANSTNQSIFELIKEQEFNIINESDPIELIKSQKNSAEINGAIKGHETDGLALTRFLFWLKEKPRKIDEISAAKKLLELRQLSPNFVMESFAAISGFNENGAIIHYHANEKTNKEIRGSGLYLIDSGAQYLADDFCATTDVTRTVLFGKPSKEMIENYTRVLKGHVSLARAKFPRGTSGSQLDILARYYLWKNESDYNHGTGHGVGSFLSVHEGPCNISRKSNQQLLPNMILSNEPGFYQEGKYGIRIENLVRVIEINEKFLGFETLTLAPIELDLIDFKMLTYPEKKWIKEYHQNIINKFQKDLQKAELQWLESLVNKIESW